jgi:spectinomycin phosphotransferase
MLEKPGISEETLRASVQIEYNIYIEHIIFLPLGYDINTAVYRIEAQNKSKYFLKLRKGSFDEIIVSLPHFLSIHGLAAIILPFETSNHRLWGEMGEYKLILYPFIDGRNGYETSLSNPQWHAFGEALRVIHTTQLPAPLLAQIPRETFSPHWRESVKEFQDRVEVDSFSEPVAARLAAFMRLHRQTICRVVERTSQLADNLQTRSLDFTLCHADIHPGNLHIAQDGAIYIVDWDNPLFGPKERDLNLIGGGGKGPWHSLREEALFYHGYGPAEIDRLALAYYRYERIVVDMAEFSKQLLLTDEGGEDREQSFLYFTNLFQPGQDIEVAIKNDR